MTDIFEWQLSLCEEGHAPIPTYQEDPMVKQQTQAFAITPDTNDRSVITRNITSLDEDIRVLTETYGSLCPAKCIEIDLDTACTLLHRDRRRVDAFGRLIKHLYQNYQTTLKITSRKTH